ncbi:kinase-like domain-containing protein [Cubamyces menziesii]|nr:kinase-like domain-containing protein [Cubamyces menziesii]
MSVIRLLFASLLPDSLAVSAAATSNRTHIPVDALSGHTYRNVTVNSSLNHSCLPASLGMEGGIQSIEPIETERFERRYGLGLLVARAAGLPIRLCTAALLLAFSSKERKDGTISNENHASSPASLLDFLHTPEDDQQMLQPHHGAFVASPPPEGSWSPIFDASEDGLAPSNSLCLSEVAFSDSEGLRPSTDTDASAQLESVYVSMLLEYFPMPLRRQSLRWQRPRGAPDGLLFQPANSMLDLEDESVCALTTFSPTSCSPPAIASPLETTHALLDGEDEHNDSLVEDDGDMDSDGEDSSMFHPTHPDGTEYHLVGKLGQGTYGRVMLAYTAPTFDLVALKVLHKPALYRVAGMADAICNERALMSMAAVYDKSFLMHLEAAWEQDDNVYLAMEACPEDLRSRICRAAESGMQIPAQEVKLLCAEMILALLELESLQIVHGDIKPENILISQDGHIVLSDFGLAQCAPLITSHRRDSHLPFHEWDAPYAYGTPSYVAPEALCRGRGANMPFTSKADVFSLGLVFAELFGGLTRPVWDTSGDGDDSKVNAEAWKRMTSHERQAARMMTEGLKDVLSEFWTPDKSARDLLRVMLQPNASDRPTPAELLLHPYFWDLNVSAVQARRIPHMYEPPRQLFSTLDRNVRDVAFLTEKYGRGANDAMVFPEQTSTHMEPDRPLRNFTWKKPEGKLFLSTR